MSGFSHIANELACANRQLIVLEEYKQLYLKKIAVGSSEKGRQFEDLTEDALNSLFPDAVVTRTTKTAHAGDFHL